MWKLKNIHAKDFMSFDEVNYDFLEKCYVVRAENKDNEGQQSNGGGKTSFVDVIAIALLGYSLTGRHVKDCCNWNTDASSYLVECSLVNKEHNLTCKITRRLYNNTRGQELTLLVNGKTPDTIPTKKGVENGVDVKLGNKYILESILDITERDLLNYFIISKSAYQPFLSINTNNKLDVISRFSKAGIVDKVIQALEVEIKTDKQGITDYNTLIASQQGYIKALEDSLNVEAFEQNKQKQLDTLEQQLSAIEITLGHKDEEIAKQEELQKEFGNSFATINLQDEIDLNAQLKELDDKEIVELMSELQKEIGTIQNFLAGLITCPKCNHEFNLHSEAHYTEEDLAVSREALEELKVERDNVKKAKQDIRELLEEISALKIANRSVEREIDLCTNTIKSIQKSQERLVAEYEKLSLERDLVAGRTIVDEKLEAQQRIDEKLGELKVFEQQLQKSTEQLDYHNKWVTNFEDFKFFLGNKPIESICSLVNNHLTANGSDLNLFIEGFKKLRSGELRQSLEPVIYRNWTNPQPFTQFSEGEKVRLNLAVDLSFQQLINQSSKYGGFDFYCNDELINPLDSIGVANAANAFNQLGKTIILVTHAGADLVYANTILIEKQNGKSKVL
jgi:exonuclease SbcC